MAANGYGYGNLPMDLYKMVTHDIWVPGTRADGQGDYREWGINQIKLYFKARTNNGRDIISPQGFVDHITGGGYEAVSSDGDTVTYTDHGFYWQIDGGQEPCDIANEYGACDWDYYQ